MLKTTKYYLDTLGTSSILCAMRAKLTAETKLFEVRPDGCRHPLWLRVPSSDVETYRQIFLKEEYLFEADRPPRTIIDAGANIGLTSIYFANRYPQARIIAIEPETSNYELLSKNVAQYPSIRPIRAALWNRSEEISLVDPGRGNWGFTTDTADQALRAGYGVRHTVRALTIPQILDEFGLEKIDVLKIDIEGAEAEVFADSSPWIGLVNAVIAELHERIKPGCNRSFYCGTPGFDSEWHRGENVFLSRNGYIRKGG